MLAHLLAEHLKGYPNLPVVFGDGETAFPIEGIRIRIAFTNTPDGRTVTKMLVALEPGLGTIGMRPYHA